jgi:hypothetical protein
LLVPDLGIKLTMAGTATLCHSQLSPSQGLRSGPLDFGKNKKSIDSIALGRRVLKSLKTQLLCVNPLKLSIRISHKNKEKKIVIMTTSSVQYVEILSILSLNFYKSMQAFFFKFLSKGTVENRLIYEELGSSFPPPPPAHFILSTGIK